MAKKNDIPVDNNIITIPLEEAMPDNYLPYAVEVSKDRALPDVRDGLKPVHRRILYGAYMLRAFPDKPYYKSARIVGDILGKYHPHGDTSVYDAMVILAQDFSTRMPLIDGHGNWGSQDGDSAAAMRYTEARLSKIALEMIRDIDKDVVNMVDNYSDTEKEPAVLPARYPNLLVNGTFGIAVGLATNIPPHNLGEVIDASLAYAENEDITTTELMEYIKGPDLPTGGLLIGKNALLAAYETGNGKVTLRSKTNIETLENGRLGIVITEFPYRKNKAKILQSISEMTGDKKHSKALETITDIRDESDRNGIRAVIEFKKSADKETVDKVLKYLFKKTELQCNISFNMVALANGKPETMGLKTILKHYINHQKEVVTRRTKRELEIAEKRFHIVEGFIKAIDIMDEIIAVIRASKSKKDAGINIVEKFGFTELQAEAILELMLYKLTGLEIKIFLKEHKELEALIKKLKKILENEKELLKVIKAELLDIKEKYNNERRTKIIEDDNEAKIDLEELIVEEDTIITLSNEGYIKRIPLKSYNRSTANIEDIEYREGDFNKFLIQSNTKDTILIFTSEGNMYQTKGSNIPEFKWKEKGERIESLVRGLDLAKEIIIAVFSMNNLAVPKEFKFFTNKGNYKKTDVDKFNTSYTKLSALRLKENENLISVTLVDKEIEAQFIKVKTIQGLEFSLEEPKVESVDRNIMGIQLFNLNKEDEVETIEYCTEYNYRVLNVFIDAKGNIGTSEKPRVNCINEKSDSSSKILVFTDKGIVYKIPTFIIQNIDKKGKDPSDIIDGFVKGTKIINIKSVKNFEEEISVYFFSKRGLVKRTALSEFSEEFACTTAYKFKNEQDVLISVKFINNKKASDAIIITKKAMCIRFNLQSVNYMGKVASGVTAISLNEDDEVIYADIIKAKETSNDYITRLDEILCDLDTKENESNYEKITLSSNGGEKKTIALEEISSQNRAGRGKNLMIVVFGDYVENIDLE